MNSDYKSRVTYKMLLGIAPSGDNASASQLYDGPISDKKIVRRSSILCGRLW